MPYPIVEKINRTDVFEVWRKKLNVYQDMLEYIKAVIGADSPDLKTNNKKVIPAINELLTMTNLVNKRLGALESLTFWRDDLAKSLQFYYNDTQAKIGDIRGKEALDVLEENQSGIDNLARGVNRLNAIIGNKRALKTSTKSNIVVALNEVYDFAGMPVQLRTDTKTLAPAVNEIFTILGSTKQLDISKNLPRTIVEAVNDLDSRLVVTTTRSISNERRITTHDSQLESHLNNINNLYIIHADLSKRAGDLAILKTPVRTSLAGAIASLDDITIKKTDKWHIVDTRQSRTLDPTKGGIDPQGRKAPVGETGGISITQRGSDLFETGIQGFHTVYRLFENKAYFGLGNINDVTHLPSELNISMHLDKTRSHKPFEVDGYIKGIMSSQTLEVYSNGISAYNFDTSANSFVFNKPIRAVGSIGIKNSDTYFDANDYYERGVPLLTKYQPRAESLDSTKLNGDKLWYPYGLKPKGAGYIFSYLDETKTINGACHSGIIRTHSVGSCSPVLQTYSLHSGNHVQSRNGYYLGNPTENGKQIIDKDANAKFNDVEIAGNLKLLTPGAPMVGTGGGHTYDFSQQQEMYLFNTTSPSFVFNKPVYAPGFVSGKSEVVSDYIVENGIKLSDKYFLRNDNLDGQQVVGNNLWIPGNGLSNPIFIAKRNGNSTEISVNDGIAVGSDNAVLKIKSIETVGQVDSPVYRINGEVVIDKDRNFYGGTTISAGSDERLKTNLSEIDDTVSVSNLKPIQYEFISEPGKIRYGFSAQETKKIIPSIVTENDKGMLGISYNDVIALLVKRVNELSSELETIKSQLKINNK